MKLTSYYQTENMGKVKGEEDTSPYVLPTSQNLFWNLSWLSNTHSTRTPSENNRLEITSLVKAMIFPVVMHGCESWTVKKADHQRIDDFELWCWRRLLRVLGLQGDPTSPF